MIKRLVLVIAAVYGYFWFLDTPDALDWKDSFDLKFSTRAYSSIATSLGEGGSSLDD